MAIPNTIKEMLDDHTVSLPDMAFISEIAIRHKARTRKNTFSLFILV